MDSNIEEKIQRISFQGGAAKINLLLDTLDPEQKKLLKEFLRDVQSKQRSIMKMMWRR